MQASVRKRSRYRWQLLGRIEILLVGAMFLVAQSYTGVCNCLDVGAFFSNFLDLINCVSKLVS